MHVSKHLSLGLLLLLLAIAPITAGGNAETDSKAAKDAATEKTQDNSFVVEHAMGTTTISGRPERVVTLTQGATEAALALDVTPVGAVQGWGADPWYPHWEERLQDTAGVGGETQPKVEKIAALSPDVIIGSTIRHDKALYRQLSAIAPTVFTQTIGEAWKENLPLIARSLAHEQKGREIIQRYEQRTTAIEAALEESGHADTTVSLVRFNPGQVRLYNGYPGAIIEDVGLSLPKEQQRVLEGKQIVTFTSKERIPLLDADVLFHWSTDWWDPGKASETRGEWTNTELWNKLSVVKTGEIHQVNAVYWNLAGGVLAAHRVLDDIEAAFQLEIE